MHVAVIYNPQSTGDSEANARHLVDIVSRDSDHITELIATERAGHGRDLAYKFASSHEHCIIISSSGDGGYNEVINGAMAATIEGARPMCAVLPSGNANDHDRAIRENSLAEAVLAAKPQPMDLLKMTATDAAGNIQQRYAHSYIGLGLTPVVAVELNRHDLTAYREIIVVIQSFAKFRPFTIQTTQKKLVLDSLIISNINGMAKFFKLAQKSSTNDGIFEVNAFPHGHKLKLLARLVRGATFGLKPTARAKEFALTITEAMLMQLDGEIIKLGRDTAVSVKCAKHAILTLA